jgi:Cu(I)/Ag(I) efflux system membrane protein CusA/SilA
VLTVSVIVLLFLWHPPSALIPLITIPVAVLVAFIPFRAMGITANIMSLGGIAIGLLCASGDLARQKSGKDIEAERRAMQKFGETPASRKIYQSRCRGN